MHPDLIALAEIDRQDNAIARIRRDKEAADASVTDARQALEEARAELKALEAKQAENRAGERETQRNIEKYEARRTSAQRVLEGGGGDPEAAERQLNSVSDILDDLETKLLEHMETGEQLDQQISAQHETIQTRIDGLAAAEAAHPDTITALKARYATAKDAREKAWGQIDRTTQNKYELLRSRKGRAVSEIQGDACRLCQRVVQPQHLSDLERGLIKPCRGCGRWLLPEFPG